MQNLDSEYISVLRDWVPNSYFNISIYFQLLRPYSFYEPLQERNISWKESEKREFWKEASCNASYLFLMTLFNREEYKPYSRHELFLVLFND